MGRAEKRNNNKYIRKKLTTKQFEDLKESMKKEYVNEEVNKAILVYQKLWTECLIEGFKKCGYPNDKAMQLLDQVELLMVQKVEEKSNGES